MSTMVSPSLLAADFTNLRSDIDMINRSEADWLHMDIMDGVFVPNISFGFPVLEAVAGICKKPLDVHFMTVHPEAYIETTARIGAMMMNIHYEACTHLHRTIHEIKKHGMKAGVTLNPSTPVHLRRQRRVRGEVQFVRGCANRCETPKTVDAAARGRSRTARCEISELAEQRSAADENLVRACAE